MQTVILNRENFGKEISLLYEKMNLFWELRINLEEKNDLTVQLKKLVDDPENTSYGPMSAEDFISEMKKW